MAYVRDAAAVSDLGAVARRQAGPAGEFGWRRAGDAGQDEAAELARLPREPATTLVGFTPFVVGALAVADPGADVGSAAGVRAGGAAMRGLRGLESDESFRVEAGAAPIAQLATARDEERSAFATTLFERGRRDTRRRLASTVRGATTTAIRSHEWCCEHAQVSGVREPLRGVPVEAIRCLSWPEFDRILRSFSILADAVAIPTPKEYVTIANDEARILTDHPKAARSLIKIEDLNRHPDDPTLIQPGLVVTSYGQKRYTVSRLDPDGTLAYDPRGTYSAHGLGHTVNLSGLPERRYHYSCHRLLHAWTCGLDIAEPAWLDTPLLTQLTIRRPADLDRYRALIPNLCGGDVLLIAHRWAGGPELITRHPGSLADWKWAAPAWIDTSKWRHTSPTSAPSASSLSASRNLRTTCSGECLRPFMTITSRLPFEPS
jgi:hypothetical protein